ncbi:MAG: integration host factor subunit beta [Nitrospirae bacterium]|nr:integration host factor subunit beta [Nitrospirota bacterium]
MTKAELTAKMKAEWLDIKTKEQAEGYVNTVLIAITDALASGDNVMLKGFGAFKVKETKARTGRNPKTGEAVQIPAGKKVSFSVSKELKERLK